MRKILYIALLSSLIYDCKAEKKNPDGLYTILRIKNLKASILRGQELYDDMCITCHLANGEGVPKAFPPLAGSDYFKKQSGPQYKSGLNMGCLEKLMSMV